MSHDGFAAGLTLGRAISHLQKDKKLAQASFFVVSASAVLT